MEVVLVTVLDQLVMSGDDSMMQVRPGADTTRMWQALGSDAALAISWVLEFSAFRRFRRPPVMHLPASEGIASTPFSRRLMEARYGSPGNFSRISARAPVTYGAAYELPDCV